MPRFSFPSLRSRAIFLVLLAILPLLALTFYSYVMERNRAVREVQRDELVACRNLATVQGTLIRSTRQVLSTLAQMPQVQRRDRNGCNILFARLMEQSGHYTLIGAVDLEGRMFASAPAASEPVNVADRLWFKKVMQNRAFFVGEALKGRISGKYSLHLSFPILDDNRQIQGVIVAALDLEWLGGLLAQSDLPPSTALVLTDATGIVLFRHPEPLKYIGTMLPDFFIKSINTQDEGVDQGIGLPGDERLFGFVRLSPPWQYLRLAIGLPKSLALAQVNHDLWRNLIWLGVVALLAMTAAWLGSELFIVRPVRRLSQVTEHLAVGDLTVRAGPQYAAGELGLLAQAFDDMAAAIQDRDEQLKQGAAELHQQVVALDERGTQLEAANKELEAFSYSVSHDLRAPLRGIAGFSRILLDDYADKLDADGRKYLRFLQSDAHKMGKLIDDLLALSRMGRREMNFGPFNMDSLAEAVFAELQPREPDRKIQIDINPMPAAYGDRAMIRQVMVNLLSNAIKFTKQKETAVIEVSGWTEGNEQVYCVRDNGDGFDMAYVHKLFGVFQRLHGDEEFEGTGVGLAIVHRIIQRHGGRVWAEGKVGEGAIFCFTLPTPK
jgi:signal transduction histidine kinase